MSDSTLEQQIAEREQRFQAITREMTDAKWAIVALAGKLGDIHRELQRVVPLAKASHRSRKAIYLVDMADPHEQMQAHWKALYALSGEMEEARWRLRNLQDEQKMLRSAIMFGRSLQAEMSDKESTQEA